MFSRRRRVVSGLEGCWPPHGGQRTGDVWLAFLFRGHVEQRAGIRVLEHPQRAVRADFHVADAVADAPALGRLGAALPSNMTRLSVWLPMPPISAEPFHCGNTRPCRTSGCRARSPASNRCTGLARSGRVSGLGIGTPL